VKKITPVWIYHEKGQIYEVKVLQGESVITYPVTNSSRKLVIRTMRQLFGRCEFTDVYVLVKVGE
jgi:hypothetical protein